MTTRSSCGRARTCNYEAPFLYLLCGAERAILLDTGAVAEPGGSRCARRSTACSRTADQDPPGYQLVVAHTHGHGDHVAGDGQFAGRPDTTVVGRTWTRAVLLRLHTLAGPGRWPSTSAAAAGDHRLAGPPRTRRSPSTTSAPASCSPGTPCIPGGCTYGTCAAFTASLDRLAEFAATRPVSHVLGCHIEMTTRPDRDYPIGCRYQPDEPPLQLSPGRLLAVRDAARQVQDKPGVHKFGDFAIYNGPCVPAVLRQIARGLACRGRRKVTLLLRMPSPTGPGRGR